MVNGVNFSQLLHSLMSIPDPELPFVNLGDLGMLHRIYCDTTGSAKTIVVEFIPSFLGCPASLLLIEQIKQRTSEFVGNEFNVNVKKVYEPEWSINRVTNYGCVALRKNGIAIKKEECPNCGSADVHLVSAFSSTLCKKLMKCSTCTQPYEAMKCLVNTKNL